MFCRQYLRDFGYPSDPALGTSFPKMDNSVLTLFDAHNEAYRGAVDIFTRQLEDKIQSVHSSITDLTRSLEFTQYEMGDLSRKVNEQQHELREKDQIIEELSEKLKASEVHFKDLYEKRNFHKNYNRRNTLHFVEIEEKQSGKTWEQTANIVSKVLQKKLQFPNIRVGKQGDHRPRPIIPRFQRFGAWEAVLRNVRNLRGSRIFVNKKLDLASQNIRKAQLLALRKAKNQSKLAYLRHSKLIIKEKHPSNRVTPILRRDGSVKRLRNGTPKGTSRGSGEGALESADVSAASVVSQSSANATPAPGVGSDAVATDAESPDDLDISDCIAPTPSSPMNDVTGESGRDGDCPSPSSSQAGDSHVVPPCSVPASTPVAPSPKRKEGKLTT